MPKEKYHVQECTIQGAEIHRFYNNPGFSFLHFLFEFTLVGRTINVNVFAVDTSGNRTAVNLHNFPPPVYEDVKFDPHKLVIQPLRITSTNMLDNVVQDHPGGGRYRIRHLVFEAKRYEYNEEYYVSYKVHIKRD